MATDPSGLQEPGKPRIDIIFVPLSKIPGIARPYFQDDIVVEETTGAIATAAGLDLKKGIGITFKKSSEYPYDRLSVWTDGAKTLWALESRYSKRGKSVHCGYQFFSSPEEMFGEINRMNFQIVSAGTFAMGASAGSITSTKPRISKFKVVDAPQLPVKPQLPGVGAMPKHPLSSPLSPATKPGTYVYVQDANGVIHVVPNGPGLHPTVLGGGQAAAAAGEIVIGPGGVITEINNISYTFQFGDEILSSMRSGCESLGFKVGKDALKPFVH